MVSLWYTSTPTLARMEILCQKVLGGEFWLTLMPISAIASRSQPVKLKILDQTAVTRPDPLQPERSILHSVPAVSCYRAARGQSAVS